MSGSPISPRTNPMRIELNHPYKSIATLATEELPDFAVLIGRNGAGKTQLLDALKEGWAVIPGIGVDEIELYDMVSFNPPNTSRANRHANQFAQVTSDAYMLSQSGGRPPVQTAAAIFEQSFSDIERHSGAQARDDFVRSLRDEIRRLPDFTVFAVNNKESPYKKALYEQVLAPLNPGTTGSRGGGSSNKPKNRFNGNQAALLSAAMKLTGKLPHELTHDDIVRSSHYEGDTLSNSVSAVFAAYKLDQFIWTHGKFDNDRERVSRAELNAKYIIKYPPPWETLREILSEMRDAAGDEGLFNFDFSDPRDHEIRVSNYEQFSFAAVMTNRTTGAQYDLDSLSSGEKILMALCLASFNRYLGRCSPKLLLLDELDAVLHPSMVAALVRTLKNLFVSKGTKVLMTSHSPMTVATLNDVDIFRVVRNGGNVKVSRTTKSEAINELSEGLATVDMGLKIAASDGARVTILTEGYNAKHLKRWVEVMGLSEDVHILEELEHQSNDQQLLEYGRLLGRVITNTRFVLVWDCDAADKAKKLRKDLPDNARVTPFAFARRIENKIARNGIENNYDEKFLEPYSTETKRYDGTVVGRGFENKRKTEFANHVLEHGTPQFFTNFQDLRDIVSRILDSTCESPCPNEPEH